MDKHGVAGARSDGNPGSNHEGARAWRGASDLVMEYMVFMDDVHHDVHEDDDNRGLAAGCDGQGAVPEALLRQQVLTPG